MKRVLMAVAVAALVALTAAPAAAHGAGGSDGTNFASRVTETAHPELRWRVLAGDALLELRNDSGREVVVLGYADEPYLRFDAAGGVYENRRSPAAYLNEDRYGRSEVPADVDAKAEPVWEQVSDGSTYGWHDHRIHWMATEDPPMVTANPGKVVEVQRWTVPYRLAGDTGEIRGVLRYVPPDPWWPWFVGAIALLTLPVLVLARRTPRAPRVGAALVGALVVANLVHVVDDLVAVPATLGETLVAAGTEALYLVVAVAGAVLAWRGRQAVLALGAAAVSLLVGYGVLHLSLLTSSQITTVLPEWYTRALVAANLALIVPVLVLVLAEQGRAQAAAAEVDAA